ncbi:MAG TPA: DUF5681 domain-containing protein [Nitrospiraceae bacterium]|nr:DUF5681 domain-containing protein [Nitrospiraceae bacterium]
MGGNGKYDVGYGKPPKHTQFKKGKSGNPGARKKAKKRETFSELIEQMLSRKIKVVENGRAHSMTTSQVIARQFVRNAASADFESLDLVLKLKASVHKRGKTPNIVVEFGPAEKKPSTS